jgi:hypothetical protein
MNIGTVFCFLGNILGLFDVENCSLQLHVIESQSISSGCDLHNGCQVGHWIEQSTNPKGYWSDKFLTVFLKLCDSKDQIIEPVKEVFLRGIGILLPKCWYLVDEH